jgi:hypothetical protein
MLARQVLTVDCHALAHRAARRGGAQPLSVRRVVKIALTRVAQLAPAGFPTRRVVVVALPSTSAAAQKVSSLRRALTSAASGSTCDTRGHRSLSFSCFNLRRPLLTRRVCPDVPVAARCQSTHVAGRFLRSSSGQSAPRPSWRLIGTEPMDPRRTSALRTRLRDVNINTARW